jgi:CBS-domain-containing membrane protein
VPTTLADDLLRDVPVLRTAQPVGEAAREVVRAELPALPVVDEREVYVGIFGEREFMAAFFPGYFGELHGAGFVPRTLDEVIERRAASLAEVVAAHVNREHIALGEDFSDAGLAERFLHHRVLIVPVLDRAQHVTGVVTRSDFFRALVERAQELA